MKPNTLAKCLKDDDLMFSGQLQAGGLCDEERSIEIGGIPGDVPILRWAGSKKKLLPRLKLASPPQFDRYVEPFVGSGVLFLQLKPKLALLSDINPHLVQAYEVIRKDPLKIWEILMSWPATEVFYYQLRACDPVNLEPLVCAARFIYLNRYCFNGVYRTNRQGGFNVSRGKGNLGIPTWSTFAAFAERLSTAEILNCDFESVVNKTGHGDFLYLDPPYAEEGKRDRGEYGPSTFRPIDIDRLLESIKLASDRGAKVLLSYSANQVNLNQLKDWFVDDFTVMRNVSGFTGKRRRADEVLISNYRWKQLNYECP